MSLASSSGTARWIVRSCRACGDVVAGPSVECSICHGSVHSHCVVSRIGTPLMCLACAAEYDFARSQHLAQQRMMAASVGFGRIAGAGGQLVGQAAGAAVTGAVGGVMRLASGAAHGVQQTIVGLKMSETPSPVRPRVLELMEDKVHQ